MSKLGIIAAKGNLSKKLIDYVQRSNIDCFLVAIVNETDPSLTHGLDHVWIHLGEVGKAIKAMQSAQVERIVFIGSLNKPDIFSIKVDQLAAKLLAKITKDKFFGDNKLLSSLTNFLEEHGFKIIGIHEILTDLVVKPNNFTISTPNEQDQIDIELGIKVALQLGALDVGQAVIVQNGIVLGVEAIEGTDQLIRRCSELKRADNYGGILVKCSKPGQELRMDLPTIGLQTIENLHHAGFKGIVIEAYKTIFLEQEEVIAYANKHQMFVQAISI